MTSLHRLIAVVAVWILLALTAVISNSSFSLFWQPAWVILGANVFYAGLALTATALIARAKSPQA